MDNENADIFEHSLVRMQETENYKPNRTEKQWEAIRDECDSGGAMDNRCNIVAASMGEGTLDVVAKRLSCGCLLVASDALDELNWDVKDPKGSD